MKRRVVIIGGAIAATTTLVLVSGAQGWDAFFIGFVGILAAAFATDRWT